MASPPNSPKPNNPSTIPSTFFAPLNPKSSHTDRTGCLRRPSLEGLTSRWSSEPSASWKASPWWATPTSPSSTRTERLVEGFSWVPFFLEGSCVLCLETRPKKIMGGYIWHYLTIGWTFGLLWLKDFFFCVWLCSSGSLGMVGFSFLGILWKIKGYCWCVRSMSICAGPTFCCMFPNKRPFTRASL